MPDHSILADGFARILSEVNSWSECKNLFSQPSREMCDNPGPHERLAFRDLQFPVRYKALVRRCLQCKHVSLEIGLFQEPADEQIDIDTPIDSVLILSSPGERAGNK